MRLVKIIGNITLSRVHPVLAGACWKMAAPLGLDDLSASREPETEELIVYDEMNCGIGEWVGISEGAEAAMPFYPKPMPIDAYAAVILDTVELDRAALTTIEK